MKIALDSVEYQHWLIDNIFFSDGELSVDLVEGITSPLKEDLVICEGAVIKDVSPIEVTDQSRRYKVRFNDVLFFQAYDALRHIEFDDEERDEGVLQYYQRSRLLNFVQENTLILNLTAEPVFHYCLRTGEEWVHVLSCVEPKIEELKNA